MTNQVLRPNIDTAGRPVTPKGRDVRRFLWVLWLLPALGIVLVFADQRAGFRLFMGALAILTLVLALAMYAWTAALKPGTIRIREKGALRFVPPRYLAGVFAAVSALMVLPAIALFVIGWLQLPTQEGSSRVLMVMPYALALFGVTQLVRQLWATRVPVGLTLDFEGVYGVRGSASLRLPWEELEGASVVGPHGPKLVVRSLAGERFTIDAHHLGSDPAVVVALIECYLRHPELRPHLADGVEAVREAERAIAPRGRLGE